MKDPLSHGVAAVLAAVLLWGVQLPVAKSAFFHIDPYHVTAIRYSLAALVLVPLLVITQGTAALRYRGDFWSLAGVGTIGMSISPLLTYLGLSFSRPEHAAIISALQPLMVAIAQWWRKGYRPSIVTWSCIGTAMVGVTAVVTGGGPWRPVSSQELYGNALIFGGAIAWVTFAIGSEKFRERSSLSFTTLTIVPGTIMTIVVVMVARGVGVIETPSLEALASASWQLLYLSFGSVMLAMFCWNVGNKRIGPLNAMLFVNFQPVVTFCVVFMMGQRFSVIEITGAGLVIAALVAHSHHLRSAATLARASAPSSAQDLAK